MALVDVMAGLFASVGILTALVHRAETGRGQKVDINLLSSLLAALVNQGTAYTAAGVVPARMGNQHPSVAPYELLRCSDRELTSRSETTVSSRLCATRSARRSWPRTPALPRIPTVSPRARS